MSFLYYLNCEDDGFVEMRNEARTFKTFFESLLFRTLK